MKTKFASPPWRSARSGRAGRLRMRGGVMAGPAHTGRVASAHARRLVCRPRPPRPGGFCARAAACLEAPLTPAGRLLRTRGGEWTCGRGRGVGGPAWRAAGAQRVLVFPGLAGSRRPSRRRGQPGTGRERQARPGRARSSRRGDVSAGGPVGGRGDAGLEDSGALVTRGARRHHAQRPGHRRVPGAGAAAAALSSRRAPQLSLGDGRPRSDVSLAGSDSVSHAGPRKPPSGWTRSLSLAALPAGTRSHEGSARSGRWGFLPGIPWPLPRRLFLGWV